MSPVHAQPSMHIPTADAFFLHTHHLHLNCTTYTCTGKPSGGLGGPAALVGPNLARWLKDSGVEEVAVSGIGWQKVLATNKKGEALVL